MVEACMCSCTRRRVHETDGGQSTPRLYCVGFSVMDARQPLCVINYSSTVVPGIILQVVFSLHAIPDTGTCLNMRAIRGIGAPLLLGRFAHGEQQNYIARCMRGVREPNVLKDHRHSWA